MPPKLPVAVCPKCDNRVICAHPNLHESSWILMMEDIKIPIEEENKNENGRLYDEYHDEDYDDDDYDDEEYMHDRGGCSQQ